LTDDFENRIWCLEVVLKRYLLVCQYYHSSQAIWIVFCFLFKLFDIHTGKLAWSSSESLFAVDL